jgi:site-specific recombinase XerD
VPLRQHPDLQALDVVGTLLVTSTRAGTDLVTVAELLGHASLDSTRIYTLPTKDDLDDAIARLTIDR